MKNLILLILLTGFTGVQLDAQYFGRNKPRYKSFDFKVKQTPHFEIYNYFENEEVVNRLGQMSEQWYDFHKDVLQEDLVKINPMIFYSNHAEFQMTNSIQGGIGVGTGGVTEAFKNRVIMPVTFTNQQTFQVLGHELVHAFQFNSILNGDSTNLRSLANLPLWLVEGMAEYMSIGRVDPYTSMWMRDAIVNDDVPTIDEMYNPKYFPYRYGQALWSFLTGYYGDDVIKPLFRGTAIFGLDFTIDSLLLTSTENLSSMWENSMKTHYNQFIGDKKENPQGKLLLSEENSGRINVSPSLSPDGRYVVFLSEKDLFTTDLFLANARTGEIIRKVSSLVNDGDLDNLNFLESSGTWSPNSKQFAFVAFKQGANVLVIKDAENGKTVETLTIPGIPAFSGPSWSPDGKTIAFTGLVDGQPDIYEYTFKTKKVRQLTDDMYSEIHVNHSEDGSKLVFSYDRKSVDRGRTFGKYTMDIAFMDLESQRISTLNVFHGADNLNPQFDFEGNIYFYSDRDGFRNLYRYIFSTGEVLKMTDLITGISGITRYSPAIAVSRKRDRVMYTHYFKGGYSIYRAETKTLLNEVVDAGKVDLTAGTLPIIGYEKRDIVNANLNNIDDYTYEDAGQYKDVDYSPKFQLDYVGGGGGIGVSTSNTFRSYTGLQGGVQLLFSDILGNNQLFTNLAVNGEILDIGGQFAYLNRKNRLAWGVGLSHLPLRTGYQTLAEDNETVRFNGQPITTLKSSLNIIRIFDEGLDLFAHYPFSTTLRLEGGLGAKYRSFRYDIYNDYYLYDPGFNFYQLVFNDRQRQEIGDEISFNRYYTLRKGFSTSANISLVGDNSYFGLTAPLAGHRFRVGLDYITGIDKYYGAVLDFRKYIWKKPFSFALRGMSLLRWEQTDNSVFPIYIGDMGFVRGYGSIFSNNSIDDQGLDFGQLIGTKMAMVNAEVRIPFTGPKGLALFGSGTFFTDLTFFFDGGVAFDEFSHFSDGELLVVPQRDESGQIITDSNGNPFYTEEFLKPIFATSVGVSMRINLFGALILEPYYAIPLRDGSSPQFGLNFIPGW